MCVCVCLCRLADEECRVCVRFVNICSVTVINSERGVESVVQCICICSCVLARWISVVFYMVVKQLCKGSPYSITEHRVLELILVLGSQPAGDISHKPGGMLLLLSSRPGSHSAIEPPQTGM